MTKKNFKFNWVLTLILLFATLTRFWNLSYPPKYIFDEVYHAFTAQAYAAGDPRGYEWWHTSPVKGTAYEWLHPPLSKLLMAASILIFGNNSFGWRFPSAVFGSLTIWLVFLVGKKIFNEKVGLIASFVASLDGLLLVQSRIAMNDIFVATFILASIYYLASWFDSEKGWQIVLAGVFAALAGATKWSGLYLIFPFGFVISAKFFQKKNKASWLRKNLLLFTATVLTVPIIYFASYGQWWLQGHTLKQFSNLHQQIWWYQTRLTATHNYGSRAWTWPLLIRPVWYFVNYGKGKIANIYALGNPLIWWTGLAIIVVAATEGILKKKFPLQFLTICYLAFWLPWLASPRVMFLYHYLPSLLFLILSLAWFLEDFIKDRKIKLLFLILFLITFLLFFPNWVGLLISQKYFKFLLWFPSWK